MSRLHIAFLVGGFACTCGVTDANAAESRVIDRVANTTAVSTYGGLSAWNRYDPATLRFQLVIHRANATTPIFKAPFGHVPEFDIGPDSTGRPTLVFSRCAPRDDSSAPGECRLSRYTPGNGQGVRRVKGVSRPGYSEHSPSIWRDRIAFARSRTTNSKGVDRLYVAYGDRLRELPRGTLRRGTDPPDTMAYARNLDLHGTRLAYAWAFVPEQCRRLNDDLDEAFPTASEVRLINDVDAARPIARKIDQGCSDDRNTVSSVSLSGAELTFLDGLDGGKAREVRWRSSRLHRSIPVAASTTALSRSGATTLTVQINPAWDGTTPQFEVVRTSG